MGDDATIIPAMNTGCGNLSNKRAILALLLWSLNPVAESRHERMCANQTDPRADSLEAIEAQSLSVCVAFLDALLLLGLILAESAGPRSADYSTFVGHCEAGLT